MKYFEDMACQSTFKAIKLFLGFAMLFIFAFVIVPALSTIPGYKQLIEHNQKNDIDAGSLFYTETDSFEEADNYFINSNK